MAVAFRTGHPASKVHVALQLGAGQRREFGCHMISAKVDFKKALGKCRPFVHKALNEWRDKHAEFSAMSRSRLFMRNVRVKQGQGSRPDLFVTLAGRLL